MALINAAIYVVAIAFTGGTSRYDLIQIVPLQTVACLCAAVAAIALARRTEPLAPIAPLAWFLAAMTALCIAQLVLLPPEIWERLPGREMLAELNRLAGPSAWRPLTLVPSRTINALTSLSVPVAALLIFQSLGSSAKPLAAAAIIGVAAISSSLGVLQTMSGNDAWLHLYSITSLGSAVGLFANPNHAAVFNAITLVVIAVILVRLREQNDWRTLEITLWALYSFILLVDLINGSRSGLICSAVALLSTVLLLSHNRDRPARLLVVSFAVAACVLLLALFEADRIPALQRLVETDPLGDLRFAIGPTLREMMTAYFPFGSGIGSFEQVYMIHERTELLRPQYVNNAHNDLAQLIIEGGLPLVAIYLAFAGWLARRLYSAFHGGVESRRIAIAGLTIAIICVVASTVDYPTRTAIMQATIVWLIAVGDGCAPCTKRIRVPSRPAVG